MILTSADVKKILIERPNKSIIDSARVYTKKLMMHMTGFGLAEFIEQQNFFEGSRKMEIRKKYAQSNKALFARLHRPIDKVFSARNGSLYYNLPEAQERELRAMLSNVEHGYTLRKWIETLWLKPYHYDPMSVVHIEIDGKGEAYPTIKSIFDIYEFQLNGRKLDYLILNTKDKQVFRVIDDAFDKLYKFDGSNIREIKGEAYPNFFGAVPAIVTSDIYDPLKGYYISPDDQIVEDADKYMCDASVLNVLKKYHGYPKAWMYQSVCRSCSGVGKRNGGDCPECNGTGKSMSVDVAETILLAPPASNDVKIAPDLGGYVTPDIEGFKLLRDDQKGLEDLMHWTYWGTHRQEEGENETATGRFIDVQPVNERLGKFSDAAEDIEEWVTNMIGQFMFPGTYKGADVNYGRRYLVESPEEVWLKYEGARKSGAPISTLNDILVEYYQTKYTSDSIGMNRHIKLMKVEPLVHNTISEAKGLLAQYPDEFNRKLYFGEWVSTLTENQILQKDLLTLRKELAEFAASKMPAIVTPEPAPILN